MDLVSIILDGYGCDLARGVIEKKDYGQVKELTNNVWVENLYKEVNEKTKVKEEIHEYGILRGDILIQVNGEVVLDIPIGILETQDVVREESYNFKNIEDGVVVTTLQYYQGLISDISFVLDGKFDIKKLEIVKKNITRNNKELVTGLFSEMYYDGVKIPVEYSTVDLRMSEMFFD